LFLGRVTGVTDTNDAERREGIAGIALPAAQPPSTLALLALPGYALSSRLRLVSFVDSFIAADGNCMQSLGAR
ncbi:MAG: hypothetical protein KDB22_23905, partial [Planctomycetales bacterium]|nr:hypothetical protein [Planctomycetales bacterium]